MGDIMADCCDRITATQFAEVLKLKREVEVWKHRALKAETTVAAIQRAIFNEFPKVEATRALRTIAAELGEYNAESR